MSPLARRIRLEFRVLVAAAAWTAALAGTTEGQESLEAEWRHFVERSEGIWLPPRLDEGGAMKFEAIGRAVVAPQGVDDRNLDEVVQGVLLMAEDLLGVAAPDLRIFHRENAGELVCVSLEQSFQGRPVVGSRVDLRLTRDGALCLIRAGGLLETEPEIRFLLSEARAAERAIASVPCQREDAVAARPIAVIFPDRSEPRPDFRPAWQVDVGDRRAPQGAWRVTLDGETGELLGSRSLVADGINGTVDGRGIKAGPQPLTSQVRLPMPHLHVTATDWGLLSFLLASVGSQPVISGDGMWIAFVSDVDGDDEIYRIGANGANLSQLTLNGASDDAPSIDDDGSRIAFVSRAGGDPEVCVVEGDGTGLTQLTANAAADLEPSISDDGSLVAFSSDQDGDFEVFVVQADGTGLAQLTSNAAVDRHPALSGDGSRVAFTSDADGDPEILVVDSGGSGLLQLTFNDVVDADPAITDDGTLVVFASSLPAEPGGSSSTPSAPGGASGGAQGDFDLFEVLADGSGLRQLTFGPGNDLEPALDQVGSCVAFAGDADGDFEIFLLDRSSGLLAQLTNDSYEDRRPSLSDDCSTIVFDSEQSGTVGSWLLDLLAPGGLQTATTDAGGSFAMPFPNASTALVSGRLRGLYAAVSDEHPASPDLEATTLVVTPGIADLHFNPYGAEEKRTAQVTAYYHANFIHDYLARVFTRAPLSKPAPLGIDRVLPVRVNWTPPDHNAYYSFFTQDTHFFVGIPWDPTNPNTAYDTVVYHEYGHFLDDMLGGPGVGIGGGCEAIGARSEGIGDVCAIFSKGSPVVGAGFDGPGTWIRHYGKPVAAAGSGDRQYLCEDCFHFTAPDGLVYPEVHDQGEAFAGFAWDLREDVGVPLAEDLVLGALHSNAPDIPAQVIDTFLLDDTKPFGGDDDPTNGTPNYDALCEAACRHGLDCLPQPDYGLDFLCNLGLCVSEAMHRTTHCERLGKNVFPEQACESLADPNTVLENDGILVNGVSPWIPLSLTSGDVADVTVTITVDPAMQLSGRYPLNAFQDFRTRYLYLNGWLYLLGDAILELKIVGTGSGNVTGPGGRFDVDTVAFHPDEFLPASSYDFTFSFTVPTVATTTPAALRFRLDYGEDVGHVDHCLSDDDFDEDCGPARFGEIEDYRITILPPK